MMVPISLAKLYQNPESQAADFLLKYFTTVQKKASSFSAFDDLCANYCFGHDIFPPWSIWTANDDLPSSVVKTLIAYKPLLKEVGPYRFYTYSQIRRAGLLIDWDRHIKEALTALKKLMGFIQGDVTHLASEDCWKTAGLLSNRLELWLGCLYDSREMQLCSYWIDTSLAALVYEQIWAKLLPPRAIFVPKILAIEAKDWIARRHLQNDTAERCLATIDASWQEMKETEQEAWLLSLKKLLIPLCALEKKETLAIDSIDFDESFDEVEDFLRTICDQDTIEDILYRWLMRPVKSEIGIDSFSSIFFYERLVCKVCEPLPLALPAFLTKPKKYAAYLNTLKNRFATIFLLDRTPLANLNEYADELQRAQKKITTLVVDQGRKALLSSLVESNINRLESLPFDELYQLGKELFQEDVRSAYYLIAIWLNSVEAHLETATIKDYFFWYVRYEKAARVIRYFIDEETIVKKSVFQFDLETVKTNTAFLHALYNALQWHLYIQHAAKSPPARLPYCGFTSAEHALIARERTLKLLESTPRGDHIGLYACFNTEWCRIKQTKASTPQQIKLEYLHHQSLYYMWLDVKINSFFALTQYPPRVSAKVAGRIPSSSQKKAPKIKKSEFKLSKRESEKILEEEDLDQSDLKELLKLQSDQEIMQNILTQVNKRSRQSRGYGLLAHHRILRWQQPFAKIQRAIPFFTNWGILAYADRSAAQQEESWYIHAVAPVIFIAEDRALQEKYSTKKLQGVNHEMFIFEAELHRHSKKTLGMIKLVRDCGKNIYYHAAFNNRTEELLPIGEDDVDLPLEDAVLVHDCSELLPFRLFYNPVGDILVFSVDEHSWYSILPQPQKNIAQARAVSGL